MIEFEINMLSSHPCDPKPKRKTPTAFDRRCFPTRILGALPLGVKDQSQRYRADPRNPVEVGELLQSVDARIYLCVLRRKHHHTIGIDQHLGFADAHDKEISLQLVLNAQQAERAIGIDIGAAADGQSLQFRHVDLGRYGGVRRIVEHEFDHAFVADVYIGLNRAQSQFDCDSAVFGNSPAGFAKGMGLARIVVLD